MRIGEAAKAAGVGVETIRFYERKGLIERPARPAAGDGFRTYPQAAIDRIRFIRKAQEIGFSLSEIKELLSLRLDPDADCGEVRARAQTKLDEVNEKVSRLSAIRTALERLIESCPGRGAGLTECSIIEALTGSVSERSDAGESS